VRSGDEVGDTPEYASSCILCSFTIDPMRSFFFILHEERRGREGYVVVVCFTGTSDIQILCCSINRGLRGSLDKARDENLESDDIRASAACV